MGKTLTRRSLKRTHLFISKVLVVDSRGETQRKKELNSIEKKPRKYQILVALRPRMNEVALGNLPLSMVVAPDV